MSTVFKAAAAATTFMTFAAFASLAGSSAVTASDFPDRVDSALLPQSVIEAAIAEQSLIPDRIEAPLMAAPTDSILSDSTPPKAQSLAALVAQNSGTQVEGREAECLAGAIYFESKGEPNVTERGSGDRSVTVTVTVTVATRARAASSSGV